MIHVGIDAFLKNTAIYIEMALNGTNIYIVLKNGTELKLSEFSR